MSAARKLVNMFLMDGSVQGRIKCFIENRDAVAIKIPRSYIEKSADRPELLQSGIYFLLGDTETEKEGAVYVGQAIKRNQAGATLTRLGEHRRNEKKNFFQYVVVITSKANTLGATELCYLENYFWKEVVKAKRFEVVNAVEPTLGNITEERECVVLEFADEVKTLMALLGYKIFDPYITKEESDSTPTYRLECPSRSADAQMKVTDEGFLVLEGSVISAKVNENTMSGNSLRLRKKYSDQIDENGKLRTDILFGSPSGASSFVVGRASNGKTEWKLEDGTPLKELID